MVFEKTIPASKLSTSLGRGCATRAYDLCVDLRFIDKHFRRIEGIDHSVFDEDKLIAHILDCIGSLRRMQRLFDPYNSHNAELHTAREVLFAKAMRLMMVCVDGKNAVGTMCSAFPGFDHSSSQASSQKRSWSPIHWACIDDLASARPPPHNDPTTLPPMNDARVLRLLMGHSDSGDRGLAMSQFGVDPSEPSQGGLYIPHWQEQYTPSDLLVMQPTVDMELVRYLDTVSPGVYKRGCALELAARHTESRELLEYLLQQQPTAESRSTFTGEMYRYPGYPLSLLIKRAGSSAKADTGSTGVGVAPDCSSRLRGVQLATTAGSNDPSLEGAMFDDLFTLLVAANNSTTVIGDALHTLLSTSCANLGARRKDLVMRMLRAQPDAIKVKQNRDFYPLHTFIDGLATAAESGSSRSSEDELCGLFDALLGAFPDAAKAVDAEGLVAVYRAVGGAHVPPHIVKTLIHRFPEGLRLRDRDGLLPAHVASAGAAPAVLALVLEAHPDAVADTTEPRAGPGGGEENVVQYACRGLNDPCRLAAYCAQRTAIVTPAIPATATTTAAAASAVVGTRTDDDDDDLSSAGGFDPSSSRRRNRDIFKPIDVDKVVLLLSFVQRQHHMTGSGTGSGTGTGRQEDWQTDVLRARDSNGWMPVHHLSCYAHTRRPFEALHRVDPGSFGQVATKVIEAEGGELLPLDPSDDADRVHMESDDTGWEATFCPYLRTPLHLFVAMNDLWDPLAEAAEAFRYLVRVSDSSVLLMRDSYGYTPFDLMQVYDTSASDQAQAATAGMAGGGVGTGTGTGVGPPSQAACGPVRRRYAAYFKRVLLRSCPLQNPDEHRALNYAARRGAMFLYHLASLRKEERRHHLWRQLRLVDHSLFKHVVSFL